MEDKCSNCGAPRTSLDEPNCQYCEKVYTEKIGNILAVHNAEMSKLATEEATTSFAAHNNITKAMHTFEDKNSLIDCLPIIVLVVILMLVYIPQILIIFKLLMIICGIFTVMITPMAYEYNQKLKEYFTSIHNEVEK
jgi:ABC-type bacteriocin/lantibiotic exporter with double-glycine peptidase domain